MDEVKFPRHLNPCAQDYKPGIPSPPAQVVHLGPQQMYSTNPCLSLYPTISTCITTITGLPVIMPFYYLLPASAPYVRPTRKNQPPPPPLSPPSPPMLPPPSPNATRALFLSFVPTDVSETMVRRELHVFGEVRSVQMERLQDGIVTVHFHDLRHAEAALEEMQKQHMQQQSRLREHYSALQNHHINLSLGLGLGLEHFPPPLPPPAPGLIAGWAVWAQFTDPDIFALSDGHNQGTLVVFNLDLDVSSSKLKEIFEVFGPVKEVRETPLKQHQRFVEFFDIRDAAKALSEMNGKEIQGRNVIVKFSRPGGYGRRLLGPCHPSATKKWSEDERDPGGPSKKATNNNQYSRSRCWKARHESLVVHFVINENALMESNIRDTRTTVMIKNIPNKCSQKLLLNLLDDHCIHCNELLADGDGQPLSSYDFIYLPIDFTHKCNLGYGFVNLTSPQATLRFYKAFHMQPWPEVFNSKKICQVTYARLQGLEALKNNFKKSHIMCDIEEYLAVVFSPPRDGKHISKAMIVANLQGIEREYQRWRR
ncbi:hypothetical protein NE237_029623 [Protea cynaroides]|uniref:RRM domain-containing protein n=1 Tax=Protea cynaroides TaxID=273540 RepID=A0A9Q0GRH9_9MAGN|nr:hypothetical protein NE237_029623 [Protea cynaroides]